MEENWKDLDNMEEEFDEEYDVNIIVNEETGEKFEVLDNFEIDGKVYYHDIDRKRRRRSRMRRMRLRLCR